jgi:tungstate transport system ATP-binding protein
MSMLAATGLGFGYEDTPVLSDVTLSADRGEVLAIIGPSGTGKTTLLRLLSLFERPDTGTVALDGEDVWALTDEERLARRKRLGMVFQDRSLFSTTVGANAAYGLTVRRPWADRMRSWLRVRLGLDETRLRELFATVGMADRVPSWLSNLTVERTVPEAARDALATVGMAERVGQRASELSAGEAQRVAFARALAPDPDALLLDEPTSNLDPRNTALIEGAVGDARDRGIAVVLATHDMDQARRVADRVAVFLDGTVIEQGPTDRVFEAPEDERARQFVEGKLVY